MLRQYDFSVLEYLRIRNANIDIPITFASPRREFGQQDELVPGKPVPARYNQTVRYPAMSLTRLNFEFAPERFNPSNHRRLGWSDDLNLIYQAKHPLPYDLHYQLDIIAKLDDDANQLLTVTIGKFENMMAVLTANMGAPFGVKKIYLHLGNISDNSTLEGDESTDRITRYSADLKLEGWFPLSVKAIRTVRKVIGDFEITKLDGTSAELVFSKIFEEG